MLKIVEGKVTSNNDVTMKGRFHAEFEEISSKPMEVLYASPVFREGGGGLFAVPEVGDRILAIYDTNTSRIYYNSTIIGLPDPTVKPIPGFKTDPDPTAYDFYQRPVKVKYQDQRGAGLCITNEYTSFEELTPNVVRSFDVKVPPRIVDSVVLKTPLNKRINLDDSPQTDAVFIKNQHKDGIVISGDSTKLFPARMIQAKSSGPQYYTCMQSHMELRVVEGTDLTIENNSTGAMAQTPDPSTWPNGQSQQQPKRFGGIYLRSENGDVSIASKAEDGRVFITTPTTQIQIVEGNTSGLSDVIVKTNGNLSLDVGGDIKIKAGRSIKMESRDDLELKSGGGFNAQAGAESSISTTEGNINVDGSQIHLNSGNSSDVDSLDGEMPDPLLNDYSD